MMFDAQRGRAAAVFAAIRADHPQFGAAEERLGSRLVVARNVLRARVRSGLTQTQIAHELGVTPRRVADIESAQANLGLDTLDHLARVLDVPTAALFQVRAPG